ncbi:MAG: hypothetical protein LBK76_04160 [Verrucomicrobiales bacterium]|jgi:hypothetical protein|nr:hypothetical protein [Verrucomicrobiales bacterium]
MPATTLLGDTAARSALECGTPVPLWFFPHEVEESGRGLPHSKALRAAALLLSFENLTYQCIMIDRYL